MTSANLMSYRTEKPSVRDFIDRMRPKIKQSTLEKVKSLSRSPVTKIRAFGTQQ